MYKLRATEEQVFRWLYDNYKLDELIKKLKEYWWDNDPGPPIDIDPDR